MQMPDKALIRCEYRMATFSVPDRKRPAPNRREREISKILGEALKPAVFDYLYPRSVIDVFIEVLQADGGSRCAAGILDGQVVIDLDDVEDKEGDGDLPFAYLPHTEEVVLLQSDGIFTKKQYKEAFDMLLPACKKIYQMQRDALTTRYSRITDEVIETLDEEKAPAKSKDKKTEPAKKDSKKKSDDKKAKESATAKVEKKKSDKKILGRKKTSPKEKAEKK